MHFSKFAECATLLLVMMLDMVLTLAGDSTTIRCFGIRLTQSPHSKKFRVACIPAALFATGSRQTRIVVDNRQGLSSRRRRQLIGNDWNGERMMM